MELKTKHEGHNHNHNYHYGSLEYADKDSREHDYSSEEKHHLNHHETPPHYGNHHETPPHYGIHHEINHEIRHEPPRTPHPHPFKFKHNKKPEYEIHTAKIKHRPSIEITEVKAPDLSKYKPISAEFDYTKYIDSEEMNEGEYYAGPPKKKPSHNFGGFKGPSVVVTPLKKVPLKPLFTPGLGTFGTLAAKFNARAASSGRPDYNSYFKARSLRQGDASRKIVQSMIHKQRAPIPRYASGSAGR